MGGGVGGRSKRQGIYVYIQLIHFIVQQKPTQNCKPIILQFKKMKCNIHVEDAYVINVCISTNGTLCVTSTQIKKQRITSSQVTPFHLITQPTKVTNLLIPQISFTCFLVPYISEVIVCCLCVWLLLCNIMLVDSPILFYTIVDHQFSLLQCILLCEYTGIYLSYD